MQGKGSARTARGALKVGNDAPRARKRRKQRILLVDEHVVVREGFAQLIGEEPGWKICGQTADSQKALYDIASLQPDVVVLDISVKQGNGIELIKRIKAVYAELPILVYSVHDEYIYAERCLRAGARGYVMKQSPMEELLLALRRVLAGERYLSPRMQERMMEKVANGVAARYSGHELERLSDRELQVLQLLGQGSGTREIALHLSLSVKTIETYREHLKKKLNLRNSIELMRTAVATVNQREPA